MRFERVDLIEPNAGTLTEDEHACKYSTREILYDVRDELERSSDPEYTRRKLHRERIRDYRRSKVMEMKKLQQEATELQEYIEKAKKTKRIPMDGGLPWQQVALALREAVNDSKCNNTKLRTKVQKQRQLVQIMSNWVSIMVHVQRSPSANLSTWRNVCLFKSDESRKLGFEWMTNHMLYHTNSVLDQCEFPSDVTLQQTNYLDLQCVWEDSGRYRLYQKHQTIFYTSLESITKALHQLYISNRVSVANVEKEDLDIQFMNDSGRYSRTQQWSANPLHFLRRQFVEPGYRSIIVGQNILDDEKYPVGKYISDAQAWIVVTQLQPGVILYQNYYTAEQLHTKDGIPLPIEQDALFAAVNLQNHATEQEKRDVFLHQIRGQWTHIIKGAEDAIRMMCRADTNDSAIRFLTDIIMVDLVMYGPCLIMASVGGIVAFFGDLLLLYVTYPFDGSVATFAVLGAFLMSCTDNTIIYISYVCATLRATKDHMSNRCIMFAMIRAGFGYTFIFFIALIIYIACYGDISGLPIYLAFVIVDGINVTMCSFLIGLWLCVRKKHKHIAHPTMPSKIEAMCMDSVLWPSIGIRYLYYLIAFSFVFLEKGSQSQSISIAIYVVLNALFNLIVFYCIREFRRKIHRDTKSLENAPPVQLEDMVQEEDSVVELDVHVADEADF